MAEGVAAYTASRAATEHALRTRFESIWTRGLGRNTVPVDKYKGAESRPDDSTLHFTVAADADSNDDGLRDRLNDSSDDE